MTVSSEQMRLLDELHRHGPKYLRDVRRAHGSDLVDVLLRKRYLRRHRLSDGVVLTLGSRARVERGLGPSYTKPSPDSLRQQIVRGQVIGALEINGYVFKEHRNPYVSLLTHPNGDRTLIAVNHKGYSSRTLRRLVGQTLFRDLLSGTELLIVDPNPKRLKNAAKDHQHLFTLADLERITQTQPPPN